MRRFLLPSLGLALCACLLNNPRCSAANPAETIVQSQNVLTELIAIPGKEIPAHLLHEAQGIAIVPRVIKIGFVAGGRRGHGVVLVRDAAGAWSLPRFVTLTGGSVGWQAGVSGTDVVLVFRTQRSVENLLKGKFTIGVDAAAAAGPVGRNAAAATDASLKSEILSYSRSRGLFLGASIDGSAIEIDNEANTAFYGLPNIGVPQAIPIAATQLQTYVAQVTSGAAVPPNAVPPVAANVSVPPPGQPGPMLVPPVANVAAAPIDALRRSIAAQAAQLSPLLSPEWQAFLAVPPESLDAAAGANPPALMQVIARYEQIAATPEYASLSARPEFQSTLGLLREYAAAMAAANSNTLQLPTPPPIDAQRR